MVLICAQFARVNTEHRIQGELHADILLSGTTSTNFYFLLTVEVRVLCSISVVDSSDAFFFFEKQERSESAHRKRVNDPLQHADCLDLTL